jgi:hypothetical protein
MFVTVMAAFEEFLRSVLVLALREKIKQAQSFKDLGEALVNRHMEYSGRLLVGLNNPPTHPPIDHFDLCRKLGTCLPESTQFELNETALSLVRDLTQLETFMECLGVFGFKLQWDDLGRERDVQQSLQTKHARETSKRLQEYLRDAVRMRNRIAHTGQAAADVGDDVLSEELAIFRATATAIAARLNASCQGRGASRVTVRQY